MARRFEIVDKIRRQYRWYNAVGTQHTVRLLPPEDNSDLVEHFITSVNALFGYVLQDVIDSDMVGITIKNQVNQSDKPIGISFRRKDQLSREMIWSVFEKVSQSNARFNALDTLVVTVHSVTMPAGFGRGIKTKGRPLSVMAQLKRSIVEVKTVENCLAHAIIFAIARLENDANNKAYRQGRKIRPVVKALLQRQVLIGLGVVGSPNLIG